MPDNDRLGRRHADRDEANQHLDRVFALLGLVADSTLVCPACGTAKAKKVNFFMGRNGTPRWGCRRCGKTGTAVDLYIERTGAGFVEALDAILGRGPGRRPAGAVAPTPIVPSFTAVHDVEVYDAVVALGNRPAAVQYWGAWHISPTAVAELGSTMLTNAEAAARVLTHRFGADRLRACGIVTTGAKGQDYFLVNRRYPVIEPQRDAVGRVSAMQFRPSPEQRVKVEAHKRFRREHGEGAVGGPKYQTPFLSPRGAAAPTLIGYGLHRAAGLAPKTPIYVVEGAKDWLAARTLRPDREVYAVPGTGVMPPDAALEVLAQLRVVVMLDGDEAGAKGRAVLTEYLRERGIDAVPVASPLPAGFDVADMLVARSAARGCGCDTCAEFKAQQLRRAG